MRYWVYKALVEVIVNKTYSNLYLKNHLHELDEKNRALATRIFYGTIQNYMYCEYVWKQYAKSKTNQKIGILLSMSVYQLLFLDKVPTYAIIDESVSIAKKVQPKASGLVNAILRKVKKEAVVLPEDEIKRLSIEQSMPEWLLRMWNAQYGIEQTKEMALYSNQVMPIYIRWNALYPYDQDFEHVYGNLYKLNDNDIANHPLYKEGKLSVQDEGSYQISCFMELEKNMNVLDCCAAPGTKSMAMAEQLQNTGHIDSIDLHAHRVQLIENDCKRLGITNITCHCNDARELDAYGMYDRILCDVPCSGYGVLSRKPDIKLTMKSEDMDTLIPLQQQILESASMHLKDNGILVYSTCTINKKENEKQIEKFLKNHSDFECVEQKTIYPSYEKDGFYMAKLKHKNLIY